jgi:hypothetical protein
VPASLVRLPPGQYKHWRKAEEKAEKRAWKDDRKAYKDEEKREKKAHKHKD